MNTWSSLHLTPVDHNAMRERIYWSQWHLEMFSVVFGFSFVRSLYSLLHHEHSIGNGERVNRGRFLTQLGSLSGSGHVGAMERRSDGTSERLNVGAMESQICLSSRTHRTLLMTAFWVFSHQMLFWLLANRVSTRSCRSRFIWGITLPQGQFTIFITVEHFDQSYAQIRISMSISLWDQLEKQCGYELISLSAFDPSQMSNCACSSPVIYELVTKVWDCFSCN